MLNANFVAPHLSLQGQMLNVANLVGKNTCKSTAAGRIRYCAVSKVTGAYEKDFLLDMVENAYVAEKQDLSSWHLTMLMAGEEKRGKPCQLNR
jgi:hypothetical protein